MSAVPIVAAYLVRKKQKEDETSENKGIEIPKNHIQRAPLMGEYALKLSRKYPGKITWIDIVVLFGLLLVGITTILLIYGTIIDIF
ncbi:hypothetical protein HO422_09240 [Streptococcus suis]|nr:hypothetical protein [Streptococcus suis]